jgi:hypothetical protein
MIVANDEKLLARSGGAAMPETIWVVGGEQRGTPSWTKEWKLYKKAVVARIRGSRIDIVLEYQSPQEHRPDETSAIVFKAAPRPSNRFNGCWDENDSMVCVSSISDQAAG